MEQFEQPLTPEERAQLDKKINPVDTPPPHLFTNIIQVMKTEGQLHLSPPLIARSPGGLLLALAALAVLFGIGYWVGNGKPATAAAPIASATGKPAFLLLVHNDDTPAADPMQQAEEYAAWLNSIKAERFADGEHLQPNGWVLSPGGAEAKAEFPGRNEVGGYFFFEAETAEEALKIAQTCPHLKYKGTLELRQVYR